jgi:protein TonB
MVLEVSFVLALIVVVGFFRAPIHLSQGFDAVLTEQETVQMEEIIQTKQIEKPPPPPRPVTPIMVANTEIIEDVELNLDATLDLNDPLADLPPPPPAPVEEQAEVEPDDEIFVAVEEMPVLIGGIESIQKYLRYPEIARVAGVQGRVYVQFVVDEEGNVVDPTVLRGLGGGCDEEALRAVKLARFKAGRQRGRPVKVRYVIPVTFQLR